MQPGKLPAILRNEVYVALNKEAHTDDQHIGETITLKTSVDLDRRQAFGSVWFIPIRKNPLTGTLEKLVSFDLNIRHHEDNSLTTITRNGPFDSSLSSGDIYKISIPESGMYKIDASFLQNELGLNIANIDPRKIKILGNDGGLLPEPNNLFRHDDAQENAVLVVGENDGSFDLSDYILFYAQGPSVWDYNSSLGFYTTKKPLLRYQLSLFHQDR